MVIYGPISVLHYFYRNTNKMTYETEIIRNMWRETQKRHTRDDVKVLRV